MTPETRDKVERALEWAEKHRKDAILRASVIRAEEDPLVRVLCEKYGYGAVMDSAARQWMFKDKSGAQFVGGCLADTSAAEALAALRAEKEGCKPSCECPECNEM